MYTQINKDSPRVPELTIDYISGKKFDKVVLIEPAAQRRPLETGMRPELGGGSAEKLKQIAEAICIRKQD
ncbi:MAG: hypothetical protein CBE36_03480 [Oceanospirillaceae bacterium TMED276]|nr:hypothetical protein [Oceanospirillaceae bacterium]OUX66187.1 MAG: hypothetical protein CBE36_03480 [Oceanospirillaceae bacterium TMED276]|tara:strand:- start:600 stop:809 length:210 start_codon:yes stop_codon:yes gene_type:complete